MIVQNVALQRGLLAGESKCRSTLARPALRVAEEHRRPLLVVLTLFASAVIANAAEPPLARTVGFYHWGGQYPTSVSQGVEQIAALGGKLARITLSPRYYVDYNLGGGCYPNFSLSAIVQEPDVKKALENEQIEVFMLTAYDGLTFGDCIRHRHLEPAFYTPSNIAAIVKEYSDLTLYLYETYRHTHKRFIVSNWESDNEVYCGAAYAYAMDLAFRVACNARYQSAYEGNRSPDDSIRGLILWFQSRQQGIEEGRNRALNRGIGGKRVYLAPEFCVVRALRDAGFKSVLYDVLPFVIFDYVSYSSYESINQAEPEKALLADLNTIQDVVGSSAIILGEVGFARSAWTTEGAVVRTDRVINAAVSWGVSYVFQWNMYDQNAMDDFGICDVAGQPTALAEYYKQRLKVTNATAYPVVPK